MPWGLRRRGLRTFELSRRCSGLLTQSPICRTHSGEFVPQIRSTASGILPGLRIVQTVSGQSPTRRKKLAFAPRWTARILFRTLPSNPPTDAKGVFRRIRKSPCLSVQTPRPAARFPSRWPSESRLPTAPHRDEPAPEGRRFPTPNPRSRQQSVSRPLPSIPLALLCPASCSRLLRGKPHPRLGGIRLRMVTTLQSARESAFPWAAPPEQVQTPVGVVALGIVQAVVRAARFGAGYRRRT